MAIAESLHVHITDAAYSAYVQRHTRKASVSKVSNASIHDCSSSQLEDEIRLRTLQYCNIWTRTQPRFGTREYYNIWSRVAELGVKYCVFHCDCHHGIGSLFS